jgi:hypothetical protein
MADFSTVFVEYDLGILLKHIKSIEVTFLHGNDDALLQVLIDSTNSIRGIINGYVEELADEYDTIFVAIHDFRRFIKLSFAKPEPISRRVAELKRESDDIVAVSVRTRAIF